MDDRPPIKKLKISLRNKDYANGAEVLMTMSGDIRVHIASYLSFHDIIQLSRVNKEFNAWANNSRALWQMVFKRNFTEITLEGLINILSSLFPQAPTDYSHNNFKTLTLATAAVYTDRRTYTRGDEVINVTPGQISRSKTMETNDLEIQNILTLLLGKKFVKYNTSKNWFHGYMGSMSKFDFFSSLARIAASFHLIRVGYMPEFKSRWGTPLLKTRVCAKCGVDEVHFRLEPGNLLFCSEACGETYQHNGEANPLYS